MSATSSKRRTKISFKDQLEKRRADLEELMIKTTMVATLSDILAQTIEDESSPFSSSEQKRVHILTEEERNIVKFKMMFLIEKYFK